MRHPRAWVCCLVLLLVGCAVIPEQARSRLSKPADCATVEQDIKALDADRASGGQRVIHGATAIIPISALIAILAGTEGDKIRVASGAYNQSIDEKIGEIRQACGLTTAPK